MKCIVEDGHEKHYRVSRVLVRNVWHCYCMNCGKRWTEHASR